MTKMEFRRRNTKQHPFDGFGNKTATVDERNAFVVEIMGDPTDIIIEAITKDGVIHGISM